MIAMTDPTQRRPVSMTTAIIGTLLCLLVLYVLSPAPVYLIVTKVCSWLGADRNPPLKALGQFYWPLTFAANKSNAVGKFYDWQFKAVGF